MTRIITFDELDSTNAEARRRAEAGERGPIWLMARTQTAGRGRRGRAWDGGQGNLAATLLFTVDKPSFEASQVAFVAAVATARMIETYVPPQIVRLKWPNDVLVEGLKACGMLIESGKAKGGGLWLAVGVGVNLATYPTGVERPATALAEHLRHGLNAPPSPDAALAALAGAFDETLALWTAEGFVPILKAWSARAAGVGSPCSARLERETVDGVAEGLDADGRCCYGCPAARSAGSPPATFFLGIPDAARHRTGQHQHRLRRSRRRRLDRPVAHGYRQHPHSR